MKALLLHCKNYNIDIGLLANRPHDIKPEPVTARNHKSANCVVAMITVERGDTNDSTVRLVDDIQKMASDVGRRDIILLPFAHLSNKLANSELSLNILNNLQHSFSDDFHVERSHFGSHKAFMLDVFGHAGNARFREY